MPTNEPQQDYKNHVKLDPPFHFVIAPLLAIFLILSGMQLSRDANILTVSLVVLAIALFVMAFRIRTYPLKVQDRLIRLEEQLRMATLLPEDLRRRALQLTASQFVALRFASDTELSSLVKRALDENLTSKQIKMSIGSWRPDNKRI